MYNEHISTEQLEQLSRLPDGFLEASGELWSHLENCPQCRASLEKHRAVNAKLDKLAANGIRTKSTMNCPDERIWFEVAAGALAPGEGLRHVQHAATCDSCGKKLKAATRIFEPELSQEEEQVFDSLPSSQRERQEGLAEYISAMTQPGEQPKPKSVEKQTARRSFWRPLSYATIAVTVALTAFLSVTRPHGSSGVERLLAQAYTENRTLEMRIPYAAHSKLRQQRSSNGKSLVNSPQALRKAADEIASALEKQPDAPRWLMLKARLDLLDWQYKPALSTLDIIQGAEANSSDVLITRALALYEQAEVEHNPQGYGIAVNLFGKVTQAHADDTVALYDQALACEKLAMYECAAGNLQHLLTIESDHGWADEALEHLRQIEEKKTLVH